MRQMPRAISGQRVVALLLSALFLSCAGPPPSGTPGVTAPPGATATSGPPTGASRPSPRPTLPAGMPVPVTAEDLRTFEVAARAFVDRFNVNWADATAAFAGFTPDAVVIDPTNMDFTIGPGPELITAWSAFARAVPDYRATTGTVYVSDTAAAVTTEVAGLPVGLPDGLLHELRVFRFIDGAASRATTMELWYELGDQAADPANTRLDCVAPDRCADDVMTFARAFLDTWTRDDRDRLAQLYRQDATVTDGARGTQLLGSEWIAGMARERFGGAKAACDVGDVYVQTDGADPRTSDNLDPHGGSIAGIAIVFDCQLEVGTGLRSLDGVTLLLFGTRQARSFDNDPEGLIASEEVLYDAASVTAAGLIP